MTIPVAHHKAIKAHLVNKDIAQQFFMTMHPTAMPAIKRSHNRLHTTVNSHRVTSPLDITQVFFRGNIVALVTPSYSAAVANKVFGRSN